MDIQDIAQSNILDAMGLSDASQEEQRAFIEGATKMIMDEVVDEIAKRLPDAEKEEFFRLFGGEGSADEDAKAAFLNAHVPDFEELLLQETYAFKAALTKVADEVKQEIVSS